VTSRELAKKLSGELDGGNPFIAVIEEGKVIGFIREELKDQEVEEVEMPYSLADSGVDKGWLDEHPEGADRGGYCPFVFAGEASAFFHDEWQAV